MYQTGSMTRNIKYVSDEKYDEKYVSDGKYDEKYVSVLNRTH